MIGLEDITHLLPIQAGKVVNIASYRGEYLIVACERGLYRLFDDAAGDVFRALLTDRPGEL